MAKFVGSFGKFSGKVGALVFSSNRYGTYSRRWVIPTNPRTIPQQNSRVIQGNMAAHWGVLTQEQRMGWDAFAGGTPIIGRDGLPITLTGEAMFIRVNKLYLGQTPAAAPVSDAPGVGTPAPEILAVSGQYSIGGDEFVVSGGVAPGDSIVHLKVTPAQFPNRQFFAPGVLMGGTVLALGGAWTTDLVALYKARFGVPSAGQYIRVTAIPLGRGVSFPDLGMVGASFDQVCAVVA